MCCSYILLLLTALGSPGLPTLSTYWPLHKLSVCPSARLQFPLVCVLACLSYSLSVGLCPCCVGLSGYLFRCLCVYHLSIYLSTCLATLLLGFSCPTGVCSPASAPREWGPQNLGERKLAQGRIEEGDFLLTIVCRGGNSDFLQDVRSGFGSRSMIRSSPHLSVPPKQLDEHLLDGETQWSGIVQCRWVRGSGAH